MKENYSQLKKEEVHLKDEVIQPEKTKSMAGPLLGLAAGLAFLFMVSKKDPVSPKNEEDTPGTSANIEKHFKASVVSVNSKPNFSFMRQVRSSLNASSMHTLDLLLSLSIYPLMTSTLIKTIKLIEDGTFKTQQDARVYMYMNLFTKARKDNTKIPAVSIPMIGHRATFLTGSNTGFNTEEFKWWTHDFNKFMPGTVYNGVNYMVRSTVPFPLTDENPLFKVNPPIGYRLVQFPYQSQPCDKWDKNELKLTDHLIPNLFDKDGISLCSSTAVGVVISDLIRSDYNEYSDGYKLNIANPASWLDDPSFYLDSTFYSPIINQNSAAYFVTSNGSTVKTETDFINGLVNSNSVLPLPSDSFMELSLRFAAFENGYGSLVTYFDTDGAEFGHYADLKASANHWAPDRMSNINTPSNIAQLAFSIIDELLLSVLDHSASNQNNHFPLSFMNSVNFSSIADTEWKDPLFPVEMRRYTYTYFEPFDPGPWM